ncbi:MAG TPA: ParB/RepB/Spo0J family partition protein [Bacteroidota bacterium]|nr:ParB/RepB/Spo0J family partition protein [Bacteroidota bacterium]
MAESHKTKSVLGKGLNALIPRVPVQEQPVSPAALPADHGEDNVIVAVELTRIRPNPYQPRRDFDTAALDELTRSIVEKGVIQPITVRRMADGGYELISGERRVRASQEAGLKNIPAYIIKVSSDEEMLELALVENLQREHLNPVEIATSYERLIEECRLTQEEVAQKIGKDRTTVTNFLRLLRLPEPIQASLRKNEISMGHARALIALPDEKTQFRLHDKIVKQGLSVRNVENLAKEFGKKSGKRNHSSSTARSDGSFQSIETRLRQSLGTKVTVRKQQGGGGEIVIEYYNAGDLDRLLELLEK